eukprot:Plantae.Rhodophyta-Purpureofilum_apyrenoidigerum.ctg47963.p1 GENE.Plantae.Rhodophyta-Purpureofilum_apyrenoidigerum.ctg47963~~Plantae.Rhodophyta-Purpureofilum_apyrenoidigerum.ctg47963.p1  ORF type:complete len:276 (-),score=45.94 Plantae.Rhodophyta-Purpureofilum_apyrenoidigerum.ctg47963:71-823(-)
MAPDRPNEASGMVQNSDASSTIHPVTIKQLLEATQSHPDDGFRVYSKPLGQTTIVAVIDKIETLSTNVELIVNDFSGSITTRFWVEANEPEFKARQRLEWTPGRMVRIYGHLKLISDEKIIVAHHIRLLQDFNEFTFHRLEAIQFFLHQQRGVLTGDAAKPTVPNSMDMSGGNNLGMYGADSAVPAATQDLANHLRQLPPNPAGHLRADLTNALIHKFSAEEVNSAIDYMHREGHLYTTVDDHHFAWCTN